MREFKCKSLGNDCTWRHEARTEELLADRVVLHLRDVHDQHEVGSELLGRIKNLFTPLSAPEIAEAEAHEPVLKEYHCDLGAACTWRYIAMTEDLIADGVAVHAREAHGIAEFSPEMIARVKQSAHAWGEVPGEEKKAA